MKIVIIEDEKAAVRNLTSLLNEIKPNGEIVTILDSISSTIEWFSSHPMRCRSPRGHRKIPCARPRACRSSRARASP